MIYSNKIFSILNLFFIICILFLINSCCKSKKCQCNEQYGVKVDDCTPKHYGPYYLGGAEDYLYFKPGSWWVYKNDQSGEMDTLYTVYCDTSVINNTGADKKWISVTYTNIGFRTRSDKYGATYTYNAGNLIPDATDYNGGINYVMYKNADFPTTSHNSRSFIYPFKPDNDNFFQEVIPTLIIQGKIYTDVAVFQIWIDDTVQLPTLGFGFRASSPTKYYWAKGIGLVLIEQVLYRDDTQTTFTHKWEITNYNLIK